MLRGVRSGGWLRHCPNLHITACGSGNFLVIAYKELRKLEHAILERLTRLDVRHQTLYAESKINIENFFGIEIDDFAVEVAILSLWIAKHQMNREFFEKFRLNIPLIPLKEAGQIRQGNAARVDWNMVCPNGGDEEIYLIGNPPYAGSSMQSPSQKADFAHVFGRRPFSKNLDYISLWFVKGADYIAATRAELAFVTTNSVAQGEHVGLMFPAIFEMGIEIGFAYTSFRWENNARRNAGVTVAVVSLRNKRGTPKYLYTGDLRIEAKNISGYLTDGDSVFVSARRRPLSSMLPPMAYGSKPTDGGGLTFDQRVRDDLVAAAPEAGAYIKRFLGADEFIDGKGRFCLWVEPSEWARAALIPALRDRFEVVERMRQSSKKVATQKLAATPYRFAEVRFKPTNSIIVPGHTSERRDYIPIGYLAPDTVVSNAAFAVYDADPWVFGILTAKMHMIWTKAVAGALGTSTRYSNTIVYNNFPIPPLSAQGTEQLTEVALRVLDVREYHSEKTLAELYDPDLMPDDLRLAHQELDEFVDSLYRKRGFESDEERLSHLFGMYEQMTAEEKRK